jgi:putative ABC transport system permease protein
VIDDLTYDNFHEDAENIYRVLSTETTKSGEMTYSITAGPLIPASKESIPEVVEAARVFAMGQPFVAPGNVPPNELSADNAFNLQGFIAEPEFLEIFSFDIISGDRGKALVDPNGILITPDAAELLFPGEDPIGKNITLQFTGPGNNNIEPYVIGLIEKPPTNSHIQFQFIIPLRVETNPQWWDSWENLMLQGYVKLIPGADYKEVAQKMTDLSFSHDLPEIYKTKLQPLSDVHLGSTDHRYDGSNRGKNDATVVYALAVIGIMITLVAAINFINLSSARASKRAREVGMRKVIGSTKSMLIKQFLGESVFVTLIAMTLALIIVQVSVPYMQNILGKQLDINFLANPVLLAVLILVAVVIGIAAGIYPAIILSSFKPVTVLKGEFHKSSIGTLVRRVLVLCQFAVSISLIICVLLIYDQIEYLKSIDLGYNRDQVIRMFAPPNNQSDLFRNRIEALPGVVSVGRSSGIFGGDLIRYEIIPEGATRDESQMFQQLAIDENFFDVLKINMTEGRGFKREFSSDTANAVLVNETAARKAGWDNPIGKRLDLIEIDGSTTSKRVVGVVKDFHFSNARQGVEPLFFQLNTQNTFIISVRLAGGAINGTITEIQKIYEEVFPNINFNYQFLDVLFDQQFNNDRDFATNIAYFSGVAILIGCLGLLGLVSYSVEQKMSEIAIRKVLGSHETSIVYLLAKDFLKWVLIANVIAWPLSYYAINLWLEGFYYRTPIGLGPFIISGISALFIALLTVSYQSIRAARVNPAKSLRSE